MDCAGQSRASTGSSSAGSVNPARAQVVAIEARHCTSEAPASTDTTTARVLQQRDRRLRESGRGHGRGFDHNQVVACAIEARFDNHRPRSDGIPAP
jgi:hypothetical protein